MGGKVAAGLRLGNLIIQRLPGATSGQGQPGAPTLVRFAGDNRELGGWQCLGAGCLTSKAVSL